MQGEIAKLLRTNAKLQDKVVDLQSKHRVLRNENKLLRRENTSLQRQLKSLLGKFKAALDKIEWLKRIKDDGAAAVSKLQHEVERLRRQLVGSKSEKISRETERNTGSAASEKSELDCGANTTEDSNAASAPIKAPMSCCCSMN